MKYRSLYIALFILAGTTHIFACEPKNDEARKQKRIEMYQRLFDKNTTYWMADFVDECFENNAIIYDRDDLECCTFYWDPFKKLDVKTITQWGPEKWGPEKGYYNDYDSGLEMTSYKDEDIYKLRYQICLQKLHKEAVTKMIQMDQDAAALAKVELTIEENKDEWIWGIAPVLNLKDEYTE